MDHFSSDSTFQEVSKGDCKRNYMHFGHSQTPAKRFGAILAMLFYERPFKSVETTWEVVFSASNSIKFNLHNSNSTEHKIAMSEVFKIIILRSFRCELIFGRFLVLHSTYIILIWKLELRQSHFLRQSHGTPKGQAERRTSRFLCPPLNLDVPQYIPKHPISLSFE